MYSEKTEIVDVVAITENNSTTYSLSKKAGDLFEAAKAGTVIRRHDVNESGNPDYKDYAYIGLSEVKLNGSGYTFKFASGDEFTASDADAYPSASSISDAIAGGGSSDEPEPLIGERTIFSGVLGDYESVSTVGNACRLPAECAAVLAALTDAEFASMVIYVDGSTGSVLEPYGLYLDGEHVMNTVESDVGKPVEIKIPAISPALINLYDPDSSDTETYYPDDAYDGDEGVFVLDISAAYERLKRGQNVWIRYYNGDFSTAVSDAVSLFYEDGDTLYLTSFGFSGTFTNYTGMSDDSGTENDQTPVNGNSEL